MDEALRAVSGNRDRGRRLSGELPDAGSLAARQEDSAGRELGSLGRRLVIPAVLGLLVLVGLGLVSDVHELRRQLGAFDWRLLAPVLALSLVNYALRFGRWQVYLKTLRVRLPWRSSLGVFLVGFVLSITPGKAGELGKAWLARELGGGEARRTVAAVIGERVTDLVGMLVLVALGALTLPGGGWVAAALLAAATLAVLLLAWERAAKWLLHRFAGLPWVGPRTGLLEEVYDRLRVLLRPTLLLAAVAVSVLAWGAEGIGFVLVVRTYAPATSWLAGVFDYSLSTLLGALSMLPGGLLAAEGTLTALLGMKGLDTAAAASATLLIRAATLWFAVLLGLLALPWVLRRVREAGRGRAVT